MAVREVVLWLDDHRHPSYGGQDFPDTIWVKTVDQAITLLNTCDVIFASLDHDVQYDGRNGMTVLEYIRDNNLWPSKGISIHSTNADEVPKMIAIVREHYGKDFQYE